MLALIAAATLVQKMPDTSLRLKVGDSWTYESTYHYRSDDIDLANIEQTKFAVRLEGGKPVLIAEWQLKATQTDGETVPVPKGIKTLVRKVRLDGEGFEYPDNEDVARHRIERVVRIERKGALQEPDFFPVPPNVRIVGLKRIVELDPRSKEESVLAISAQETAGDKPIKALGYYSLFPNTGILKAGHWTLIDSPIPGGDARCELEVTIEAKDVKLAPRG
jgi:hypothetical protein